MTDTPPLSALRILEKLFQETPQRALLRCRQTPGCRGNSTQFGHSWLLTRTDVVSPSEKRGRSRKAQGEELEAGPTATTRRQHEDPEELEMTTTFMAAAINTPAWPLTRLLPPPTADFCFMRQSSPVLLLMTPLKLRSAV